MRWVIKDVAAVGIAISPRLRRRHALSLICLGWHLVRGGGCASNAGRLRPRLLILVPILLPLAILLYLTHCLLVKICCRGQGALRPPDPRL